MVEAHDQSTPPYGTDRWGEPVFGDGITTGSYVFMPRPGHAAGERDVFQVAFVGGRPEARGELVAFGWLCDAATGEWEPWWQSVGPNSVATVRALDAVADETQQQEGAAPVALDLADGPVRCPLCPNIVTLHTPNGARAHFTIAHPEERLVGSGPWPLLANRADEAQQPCDGCGHPGHPARECMVTSYGERCACDEPVKAKQAEAPASGEIECANCWRLIENRGTPSMGGPSHDNWVHVPGGFTVCFPQRGADSPRAEPKRVVAESGKEA